MHFRNVPILICGTLAVCAVHSPFGLNLAFSGEPERSRIEIEQELDACAQEALGLAAKMRQLGKRQRMLMDAWDLRENVSWESLGERARIPPDMRRLFRDRMDKLNCNEHQLADLLDENQIYVNQFLKGERKSLPVEQVQQLCNHLRISPRTAIGILSRSDDTDSALPLIAIGDLTELPEEILLTHEFRALVIAAAEKQNISQTALANAIAMANNTLARLLDVASPVRRRIAREKMIPLLNAVALVPAQVLESLGFVLKTDLVRASAPAAGNP